MIVSGKHSSVQVEDCPDLLTLDWNPPTEADRTWAAENIADYHAEATPFDCRVGFAQRLADHAAWFRSFGNDYGDLVGDLLDDAARTARFLHADSPAEFRDRLAVMEGGA